MRKETWFRSALLLVLPFGGLTLFVPTPASAGCVSSDPGRDAFGFCPDGSWPTDLPPFGPAPEPEPEPAPPPKPTSVIHPRPAADAKKGCLSADPGRDAAGFCPDGSWPTDLPPFGSLSAPIAGPSSGPSGGTPPALGSSCDPTGPAGSGWWCQLDGTVGRIGSNGLVTFASGATLCCVQDTVTVVGQEPTQPPTGTGAADGNGQEGVDAAPEGANPTSEEVDDGVKAVLLRDAWNSMTEEQKQDAIDEVQNFMDLHDIDSCYDIADSGVGKEAEGLLRAALNHPDTVLPAGLKSAIKMYLRFMTKKGRRKNFSILCGLMGF